MKFRHEYADLADDDWVALREDLHPAIKNKPEDERKSDLLLGLLEAFRAAGAVHVIEETTYIDRDFSAAYAAFYSTLYRSRQKHCRRIHFFASSLERIWESKDPAELAARLQADGPDSYLGYIVIRPVAHAPVSHALVTSRSGLPPGAEVAVRSTYKVHLLGAELEVEGAPLTEQDGLTGSCAQATIWAAGRHLHNRHSMAWFSVVDITEAAIKPTDSALSQSLPVGSESLNADNIVRALRAMGEHPVVYNPERGNWSVPPARTVSQYLDSGIPVIIGLRRGEGLGHAVVAVGTVAGEAGTFDENEPSPSDANTHFLVNDDQRGPYQLLAIQGEDGQGDEEPSTRNGDDALTTDESETTDDPTPAEGATSARAGEFGYTLADAIFLIVPLPNKVFLKAEVAEAIARDKVESIFQHRDRMASLAAKRRGAQFPGAADPDFHSHDATTLLARTYLTPGWKYRQRMMRNAASFFVLAEVGEMQLPRYVWVTEFSLAQDASEPDPCLRKVRGHVLIDATGSRFDDSAVLLAHVPGLLMGEIVDPEKPEETKLTIIPSDSAYRPKVRGWPDFSQCHVPETATSGAAEGRTPDTK